MKKHKKLFLTALAFASFATTLSFAHTNLPPKDDGSGPGVSCIFIPLKICYFH